MAATSGQLRALLVLEAQYVEEGFLMSAPRQAERIPKSRGADPSSGAERNPQTQGEDAWSPHPAVCASGTWRLA